MAPSSLSRAHSLGDSFDSIAHAETPVSLTLSHVQDLFNSRYDGIITKTFRGSLPDPNWGDYLVTSLGHYKNGSCHFVLLQLKSQSTGQNDIWLRVERGEDSSLVPPRLVAPDTIKSSDQERISLIPPPLVGPDTIKLSSDRLKLWNPGDVEIMASTFTTLNFRHVMDLLNTVNKVTIPFLRPGSDSMWYAGVVMGLLHGGFGKYWDNPPPPDWVNAATDLFGRHAAGATQFVELQFSIQHPNVKRISLMEPETWKNEPTPLSQQPSPRQDDRKGADSNLADTEKIAHVGSAPTLSQEHLQDPRPVQSPNGNGVVPSETGAEENGNDQRRDREMEARLNPGVDPSNVLASRPLESIAPYDLHRRSMSQSRNPLSGQTNERQPVQPADPPSTRTPLSRVSPEESSTGIDEAASILQGIEVTARPTEALGRGPQASQLFTNAQPPRTPNLTGRIVRVGSTPIAMSGYSSVWRGSLLSATSNDPDRALQVAIKVLRPSYADQDTVKRKLHKRLHVEMRVWAQLRHENVVRLLGHTEEPEGPGLVSISYPHGNVLSFLAKNPSVNREIICADVALGLQYLHEHEPPIIHGDLKGPNVLIDAEGRASICDFGLSIVLDGGPTGHTSSNFGGSLRFLAPELLEESSRTVQTDVYAYACTCIAILFDQEPYHQVTKEAHLMRAILSHRPPFEPLNEEPTFPSFWRILKRCWDHNRMNRPSLDLIIDIIQRCLFRTYRTNLGAHQGIGRRVRFMCLPGIEQANLISVDDGGLSIVVNSSTSLHRVPIYQRYRWELIDRVNLGDSDGDSDIPWSHKEDHQYSPFTAFSHLSGKTAQSSKSPPYVSKWNDYSSKFRLLYSLMVSYEPYNKATSEIA